MLGSAPLGTVAVNAGSAKLEIMADGYAPYGKEVELPGGQSMTLEIELTPKAESSYAYVTHRVNKQTFAQTETHYFNDKGEEVKRFINSDFTEFHGVKRNRLITVSDPRTSRRTEMEIKDFVVNQGLKDDLFTVRNLAWGK